MRLLVTGGAGFIGSNFIHYVMKKHGDDEIICVDKLTYAANYDNIKCFEGSGRFRFEKADICDKDRIFEIFENNRVDCIVNFAAESHVDKSLDAPEAFLQTNIVGTGNLLDAANRFKIKRFHQASTDEVYGELPLNKPELRFDENSAIKPSSPYSASKAAADMLATAYCKSFGTPVSISRCLNNYGPYQHEEKLIPLVLTNDMADAELPIYGDGKNIRDWIYVDDHCRGIDLIIRKGSPGEIYNIGASNEISNIELVRLILKKIGKPESLIKYVEDRKGHDLRYAVCADKIKARLGWQPITKFNDGLDKTINWYLKRYKDKNEVTI